MAFEYRRATLEELERIWEKNIRDNTGDPRWVEWRLGAIENHLSGRACTYVVLDGGDPVGEGTLLFSPDCGAIRGRTQLADGVTAANVNALRMQKAYEGQGHMSRLVRVMEQEARARGFSRLTIGVEAKEARNLAIYLHWGYTAFLLAEVEDGSLVLYYGKGVG